MTIKNIGSKIISVGTTALLPDDTMPANEALCNTPAIKAFVRKNLLSIIEDPKVEEPEVEEPKAEEPKVRKPRAKAVEKPEAPETEAAPQEQ